MGKYRSKQSLYGFTQAHIAKKRNQDDRQPQVIRDPWRQRFPKPIKNQSDQQPDGEQVEAHEN
ncbi:MAG: hypothetical protein IJ119_15920 [Clostridia bacterium]|nr:hypothetical protein [Clostridia bacterium]